LIHPLDSLKVKMQTFPHLYHSGVQCARDVTRQDGLRGLYRGLTPGVTLSMTEASIRYMTYGVCQVYTAYSTCSDLLVVLSLYVCDLDCIFIFTENNGLWQGRIHWAISACTNAVAKMRAPGKLLRDVFCISLK